MESVADEMWHVRAEHGQTGPAQKYEFAACNNRLSLVFDSIKEYAVFMVDPQGRITSWNGSTDSAA